MVDKIWYWDQSIIPKWPLDVNINTYWYCPFNNDKDTNKALIAAIILNNMSNWDLIDKDFSKKISNLNLDKHNKNFQMARTSQIQGMGWDVKWAFTCTAANNNPRIGCELNKECVGDKWDFKYVVDVDDLMKAERS